MNIYEIKVLPKDERSLNKFNSATYQDIDGANPNSIEPSTTYTLPYWLGIYHNMIDISWSAVQQLFDSVITYSPKSVHHNIM